MKMTNAEIHVLKDAIDAFNNKISRCKATEIAEITRYLQHQYRLLAILSQYEQTIND